MKVAIVHYWLVTPRGGEKVLEALCNLFPDATIFTHIYVPSAFSKSNISNHKIVESFISKLPFAHKVYQSYLPLMPIALEELDLRGYDLVISSESGPAKGVIVPPGVPHICYCHSPMRYLWDMYLDYKVQGGRIKRFLMPFLTHYLRRWDQLSSIQVTHFVANSRFVASRIKSYYNRESIVIHPPVDLAEFTVGTPGDYYLMLGQLVSYKRADIAVEAFNKAGHRLVIIGEGEELSRLKKTAKSNIEFLGRQSFEEIKRYLASCKALIFPGLEDFGIVPVEAMASGRPVIAYGRGGVLDTVIHGKTGILFGEQNPDSLIDAVSKFEETQDQFDPSIIRSHAEQFSSIRFANQFNSLLKSIVF